MEENKRKNQLPADDERRAAIGGSMGCLLVIIVMVFGIAVGLIILYMKSILTGSKEFFMN